VKRARHAYPIKVRLLLTLLPLLTCVLVIFGLFCNTLYQRKIEEEVTRQLQLQVDSVAYQMNSTLSEINRLSLLTYSDAKLREGLNRSMMDDFTFQERVDLYTDVIYPILTYMESPNKYSVWLFPVSDRVFCDHSYVYATRYFPDEALLKRLMQDGYGKTVYHMGLTAHYYSLEREFPYDAELLYISRVISGDARNPLAIVSAVVYADYLRGIVESIAPDNAPFWYSVSLADGEILLSSGEWQEDMLLVSTRIPTGNLLLQIGFTSAVLAQQSTEQTRMLLVFGCIMLLASALMIIVVCRMIMKPLYGVVRKFRRLQVGAPLIEEPRAGQDEAALIDQTVTSVYRKYYKSVQDQETMEAKQKNLEIALLLSRINPHFLYNTLSALRWSMPEEDRHIIDRLVAYYRGVLGQGRDIASLSRETELLEQYIDLQRYTYSKRITLRCDIDDELSRLMIPKFILQPIVENAVKTCAAEEALTISLSAHQERQTLVLCVDNDGPPIAEDVMRSLNALNDCDQPQLLSNVSAPDEARGYGVFNVIMRIRLTCGSGYGLWHERPAAGGTRARYVLPAARDASVFTQQPQDK